MKQIKLLALSIAIFFAGISYSQIPGTTSFNNDTYDQIPFASGVAYPSVMTATNVAGTGWNFHIGALGAYVITQTDFGTGSYDGAISATNVTPLPQPSIYQTFGFSTQSVGGVYPMFKLNSMRVRITNSSSTPLVLTIAGVVGTNAGGVQPLLINPGTNWYTVNTSTNTAFDNINGVLVINGNGIDPLTASVSVREIAIDDINTSNPVATAPLPSFTTHPSTQTICAGSSTTFTATANNAVSYFWLMSNDGLLWNPINPSNAGTTFSGYNTNTLTVSNAGVVLDGLYLMATAVNATGGNRASNIARLHITNSLNAGTITGPDGVCIGSTASFTSSVSGGTWSVSNSRASVTNPIIGIISGRNAGAVNVVYTLGSGNCSATVSKTIMVNSLPGIPSIAFAAGGVNPIAGPNQYCRNRTFTLNGFPSGGAWSSSGVISVTNLGVVSTGSTLGAGGVTYTVTNSNGCSSSRSISGTVVACTPRGAAVNTTFNSDNYTLYPNPAKSIVNVSLKSIVGKTNAVVTDIFGKVVLNQTMSLGNNTINVSGLAKGIYNISFINEETRTTQKLVVQ